jgi:hypothetical protein
VRACVHAPCVLACTVFQALVRFRSTMSVRWWDEKRYQPVGGGGPQNAKFFVSLYNFFGINLIMEGQRPALEVLYAQAAADGQSGTVDGTQCTVYRYDCAAHPGSGADPNCLFYDFCVSDSGHLLVLNASSEVHTQDPSVKLHVRTVVTVNGPLDPDPLPATFTPPVAAQDCLDLKAAAFDTLSPAQVRAHSRDCLVNDPERVDAINAEAAALGWVAGPSAVFGGGSSYNWTVGNSSVLSQVRTDRNRWRETRTLACKVWR